MAVELITALIGLGNIVFFSISIAILVKKSNYVDLKVSPVSDLSKDEKVGKVFNTILFIFALIQIIFAGVASELLLKYFVLQETLLFSLGGLSLITASVFSTKRDPRIHQFASVLSALLVSMGVILLSVNIIRTNLIAGILLFGGTLLIPTSFSLRNKLRGAYWEFLLFFGVLIWNVTISILIIRFS